MLIMYTAMIDSETDKLRFTEIYNGYRKQMILVAMRVLNNHEDAEDAVQNAFLGIARNIKSLPSQDPQRLRVYVLTAAKNAALSLLPKKQQWDNYDDISKHSIAATDDLFQQIMQSEDYDLLLRAMKQLSPPYREVLFMIYVQEHSVRETAAVLRRQSGTVRQQLNRGKKLLIDICRKEGMIIAEKSTHAVSAGINRRHS